MLAFNHLLLDGYGVKLFAERMMARYNALLADPASPAPAATPAPWGLAARERDYQASPRAARDLAFWQLRLPAPEHAPTYPPPAPSATPPLTARWLIAPERWDALDAAARSLGLSVAQALSGLIALYIARIADSADAWVALPLHNRLSAEDKQTLGLFVNVLPLLWPVPREQPLAELLQAYAAQAAVTVDVVIDPRAPAPLRHTAFLAERLHRLLDHLLTRADQPLLAADLIGSGEAAVIAAANATARTHPGPTLLHELVWAQAERTPQARLLNFYRSSEATEDSTAAEIDAAALTEDGVLPIGRPVDNTQVHVLDARGRVQPLDVPGELCIGGAGVALGYLGQPELTAERFVPDPFVSAPDARLYRSGDIGWLRADGQLVCLGRNDQQVKIRGYRIELGEIEAALAAREDIAQAAVIVHDFGDGSPALCVYLVARPGQPRPDFAALRAALAHTLPDYMIPASWQWLAALPLTASGKVDRRALPAPRRPESAQPVPPRTDTERRLHAIWSEVLGAAPASVHDHFFALGGHSLLAARAALLIEQRTGLLVHPRRLVHETLAQIARPRTGHSASNAPQAAVPTAF